MLALTILWGCKAKKINDETPTETVPEKPNPIEIVARDFGKAMINNDISLVEKYYADVAVARYLSPKAKEMSDEEIQATMLDGLHNRFISNFEALQNNIITHSYDRNVMEFGGYKYYETDEPITVPRALNVKIKVDEQEEVISITTLLWDENIYLFEILNTTNVFVGE